MELDFSYEAQFFWPLLLSVILGGAIGVEREFIKKAAGIRTHALVSLGSTLFTLLSYQGLDEFIGSSSFDPSRIASQIVVGVGFLGAGIIIYRGYKVRGLTTAAGIWVAAAIGMAVGFGFYFTAVFVSLLVVTIFYFLGRIDIEEVFHRKGQ